LAEDVVGQHVEHRRLVERLHRELGEQAVAPVKQIVDVAHDDRALARAGTQPGDRVRVERIVLVGGDRG